MNKLKQCIIYDSIKIICSKLLNLTFWKQPNLLNVERKKNRPNTAGFLMIFHSTQSANRLFLFIFYAGKFSRNYVTTLRERKKKKC